MMAFPLPFVFPSELEMSFHQMSEEQWRMYIVATDEVAFNFQLSAFSRVRNQSNNIRNGFTNGWWPTQQIFRGFDHFDLSNLQTLFLKCDASILKNIFYSVGKW